jgi:hypothetical protein
MEALDTTIANVALPYIAGGVGVSEDEASCLKVPHTAPYRLKTPEVLS